MGEKILPAGCRDRLINRKCDTGDSCYKWRVPPVILNHREYVPKSFQSDIHLEYHGSGVNRSTVNRSANDRYPDDVDISKFPFCPFIDLPESLHDNINCKTIHYEVSAYSDIGARKYQEDRTIFVPQLIGANINSQFIGVFDGTVGSFASDTVKDLVIPELLRTESWQMLTKLLTENSVRCITALNERRTLEPKRQQSTDDMMKRRDNDESSVTDQSNKHINTTVSDILVKEFESKRRVGDSSVAIENNRKYCLGQYMDGIVIPVNHDVHIRSRKENMSDNTTHNDYFATYEISKGYVCSISVKGLNINSPINDNASNDELAWSSGIGDNMQYTAVPNNDDNRNLLSTNDDVQLSYESHPPSLIDDILPYLMMDAMGEMHIAADESLLSLYASINHPYASSTSVTALIIEDHCCIAHLGDSRIALGYLDESNLKGSFLTVDHRPNLEAERKRIVANGGSVEYLHNHENLPFIRGGNFSARKAAGLQVMQLQYSRAFGGKNLKMFGLSNETDLRCFKIDRRKHRCLILASDGLWDLITAERAVHIVTSCSRDTGRTPAETLVFMALNAHTSRYVKADNVTALVMFFTPIEEPV